MNLESMETTTVEHDNHEIQEKMFKNVYKHNMFACIFAKSAWGQTMSTTCGKVNFGKRRTPITHTKKKQQKENRPKEPPHQKNQTQKKHQKLPHTKKTHQKKSHQKNHTKRKTIPKRGMALIMWWYMNSLARQQTAFNLEFKLVHSALPNHQLNKQLTCDYVMLKWTWNIYDKCDLADSNISFWEQIRESSFDIRAPKLMQTIKQSIWILQMQQC